MASKIKTVYICSQCGYESAKWFGQCPGCGEWNTMSEEVKSTSPKQSSISRASVANALSLDEITADDNIRYKTGFKELDRVLGGGLVNGSLVLLSGDPGIGKSTILLQICQSLGENLKVLYVTGEESAQQIKLRAKRLGVTTTNLFIMCENNVQNIIEYVSVNKPDIMFIDSIQTMTIDEINSSAGSVTQIRESTSAFMRCSKSLNIPTIIVGHVNKDGNIAGP
ncbi:MAG: AAA family ATPase, partial [Clostridia bacterium]|nr:AAA family ATPase [Clostridia bacterium]